MTISLLCWLNRQKSILNFLSGSESHDQWQTDISVGGKVRLPGKCLCPCGMISVWFSQVCVGVNTASTQDLKVPGWMISVLPVWKFNSEGLAHSQHLPKDWITELTYEHRCFFLAICHHSLGNTPEHLVGGLKQQQLLSFWSSYWSDAGLLGSWHLSWGHSSSYPGFYGAWVDSGVINVPGSEKGQLDHFQ